MAVEINRVPSIRLTPVQEINQAKPITDLYVGQILKTVVVTALTNDQVLININGQNFNANSAHRFTPGELLDVKVVSSTPNETILEVQQNGLSVSILQNALLQNLPKQAPATNLFQTLSYLVESEGLHPYLREQIRNILANITPVSQLPQRLVQGINQSGMFLESILYEWQRGKSSQKINTDFKGQCFKLLTLLPADRRVNPNRTPDTNDQKLARDPLPLPGAIPQPLQKDSLLNPANYPIETLLHIVRNQVIQVLARITANQVNHLTHDTKEGYLIMLDVPVRTHDSIDVIPLMIKQHNAEPMQPSRWSVSFALSLPTLGDMQGTVSLTARHIDIKINTQNNATMEQLNEFHPKISELLAESGLKLRHWNLQLGLENNHIDVENLHLLDIRI